MDTNTKRHANIVSRRHETLAYTNKTTLWNVASGFIIVGTSRSEEMRSHQSLTRLLVNMEMKRQGSPGLYLSYFVILCATPVKKCLDLNCLALLAVVPWNDQNPCRSPRLSPQISTYGPPTLQSAASPTTKHLHRASDTQSLKIIKPRLSLNNEPQKLWRSADQIWVKKVPLTKRAPKSTCCKPRLHLPAMHWMRLRPLVELIRKDMHDLLVKSEANANSARLHRCERTPRPEYEMVIKCKDNTRFHKT